MTDSEQSRYHTISVPLGQFSTRMSEVVRVAGLSGQPSMHSRLSLIHQTAKQFAIDAVQQPGAPTPTVDIDELTNPPLLDLPIDPDDEQQVIIQFSYQPNQPQ
ncbi:hypothetical protein [Spirosoma rhododendri]|uniref:Uncharacterized protein n=1 Tax=Spirosoma rhododendri TaxID=2728024 RepID=A0A7L5DIK0_9BACT|nr:hypothetical protein [Spirosoma rhododendri]QJD77211.1 hypothetical protein HH216_01320 [Spirosoma rhododendri]